MTSSGTIKEIIGGEKTLLNESKCIVFRDAPLEFKFAMVPFNGPTKFDP